METYQIFVVLMGNTKITEKLEVQASNYSVTINNKKDKARGDFDDEESIKDQESPSDKIEESKENIVAPISEKYKITK